MDPRVLAAAGIDPDLPAAQAAALLVRRFPLRWHPAVSSRDPDTVVESGWFAGPSECARVLGRLFRGTTARGGAFGSPWPFSRRPAWWSRQHCRWRRREMSSRGRMAPIGSARASCGARRRASAERCWRPAAARRRRTRAGSICCGSERPSGTCCGAEASRWRTCSPGSASRPRGSSSSGWWFEASASTLRHSRASPSGTGRHRRRSRCAGRAGLVPESLWRDPAAVLGRRVDIRRVERRGDEITAETRRDATVMFRLVEEPRGWRLFTWDGDYPFRTLALHERAGSLSYSATLGPELDPLGPGIRGRLAFDLRSDLVALGRRVEKWRSGVSGARHERSPRLERHRGRCDLSTFHFSTRLAMR